MKIHQLEEELANLSFDDRCTNPNSFRNWKFQDLIFKLDEVLREEIDSDLIELIEKEIDRRCQ